MSDNARLKRIEKQARACDGGLPDGYLAIAFEGDPDLDQKLALHEQLIADGELEKNSMFIVLDGEA